MFGGARGDLRAVSLWAFVSLPLSPGVEIFSLVIAELVLESLKAISLALDNCAKSMPRAVLSTVSQQRGGDRARKNRPGGEHA